MKIKDFWLDREGRKIGIHFESEDQEESHLLVELGACIKKPNIYYGKIEDDKTWACLFLPISNKTQKYFGNDK